MNGPNRLTVARIALTFAMTAGLTLDRLPFGKTLALGLFLLAAATDYLDGWLARRTRCVTAFGQLLDPLADKVLVSAAFICFVANREIVPAWIAILIVSREFLVTGLRLLAARQGRTLAAGFWGKHKTVWQIVVILVVIGGLALRDDVLPRVLHGPELARTLELFERRFRVLTYGISAFAAGVTVLSGLRYAWEHRALLAEHP